MLMGRVVTGLPGKIPETLPIHVSLPVSGPSVCAVQRSVDDPEETFVGFSIMISGENDCSYCG